MTTTNCPNGWDDRPTCTHPVCPVHKDEATIRRNHEEFAALAHTMKENSK